MFGIKDPNLDKARNLLKGYDIDKPIYMNKDSLKEFFGKEGVMRKLAVSKKTNES